MGAIDALTMAVAGSATGAGAAAFASTFESITAAATDIFSPVATGAGIAACIATCFSKASSILFASFCIGTMKVIGCCNLPLRSLKGPLVARK